jgi:5-hydroxyisourate hydrolase
VSGISTHVLDLTRGRPASGVAVLLARESSGEWVEVSSRKTDRDGRVASMLRENEAAETGLYRLHFETAPYFRAHSVEPLHPFVEVFFEIRNPSEHYHIPLLLTPYSYSTYRGS